MGRPSKTFGIPESASAIRNGRGRGRGRFVKVRNAHTAGHTDVTTANSAEDKFVELQESSERDGNSFHSSAYHRTLWFW